MPPAGFSDDELDLISIFGAELRRRRTDLDLTQAEVARRAGLHVTHLNLMERGNRAPRLPTILRLAGALEMTPAELLELLPVWEPPPLADPARERWTYDRPAS